MYNISAQGMLSVLNAPIYNLTTAMALVTQLSTRGPDNSDSPICASS